MISETSEQDWIERIKTAYVANDYPLANSLMGQALVETDSKSQLLEIAGMMAYERGEFRESIRLIESAMFEVCLSISGQMTLANAWIKLNNLTAAETTLTFLVESVDRVPCSMLPDLTQNVVQIGRDDLAAIVCEAALARHPGDDNAAFGAGFYLFRSGGSLKSAMAYMSRAVELNPICTMYRVNLAIVCKALGKWEMAYFQASEIPVSEIQKLRCECVVNQLNEIYLHFEDYERLAKIGAKND
ncbi:MAG: hypothetical protein AAFN77_03000 [Planctomycetota bacterium]